MLFSVAFSEAESETDGLFPSARKPFMYEIGEIRFVGNKTFSESEFTGIIESKPTERSFQHVLMQYYNDEFRKNTAAPKIILVSLETALESMSSEIRYFEKTSVARDVQSIWHFYNMNGFHQAKVSYTFLPDSSSKRNVITFHIEENSRSKIDTIVYIGLDSLPNELLTRIKSLQNTKTHSFFNEQQISSDVNRIHGFLLNNGYFYAYYDKPMVTRDTIKFTDSVTIEFFPGGRKKIGTIRFIDSTRGQHAIAHDMQMRQLEFKTGDWYSREKVQKTIENLLSLGVYDFVSIDTVNTSPIKRDSVLHFRVFSQYRKLKEWNFGLFVNQTPVDNYTNAGVEGSVLSRNLFGAAQSGNVYGSVALRNLSDFFSKVFSNKEFEYEYKLGFKIAQPLLWTLDNSRVGLNSSFIFSYRSLTEYFTIQSITWDIRFPVLLPDVTYFNNISIDFSFERQNPINFIDALKAAVTDSKQDPNRIREYYYMYTNLYVYLQDHTKLLTSNLIGLSISADKRNNPFSPTDGLYTLISLDGWNVFLAHPSIAGISKYFRAQFVHYHFLPLNQRLVAAFKGRLGFIYNNEDDDGSYVPLERQFFCGGANSVRGWASRSLRYTKIKPDTSLSQSNYDFLSDFFGNRGLIEGSVELRYRFARIPGINKMLSDQVANIGINVFMDFGNAFLWMVDESTKPTISDLVTKLAFAAGAGLRYETPFGPIRLDFAWPIYDPLFTSNNKLQIHIGLGHAF